MNRHRILECLFDILDVGKTYLDGATRFERIRNPRDFQFLVSQVTRFDPSDQRTGIPHVGPKLVESAFLLIQLRTKLVKRHPKQVRIGTDEPPPTAKIDTDTPHTLSFNEQQGYYEHILSRLSKSLETIFRGYGFTGV
jgi:hypothetical protein